MIDNLRLIEIEIHSYCNRKCAWCPNKFIDRQSGIKFLDLDALKFLLIDLQSYNYKGAFTFSRYNEPFAYFDQLMQVIKVIKDYFPKNKYITNTNGDYITKEKLKLIPLDEITIMDYDNRGKDFIKSKFNDWDIKLIKEYNDYILGEFDNKLILYYTNWNSNLAHISDRGGSLIEFSADKRTWACYEPMYFLGINYDGTVSPCCNIRNDIDSHQKYILGDLHKDSIVKILNSQKYLDFVSMCTSNKFLENSPCYYCNNHGGRYTREEGNILYD